MNRWSANVREKQRGFSLMELLIIFAILVFLILMVLVNLRTQLARARDSQRKTDLEKIQKVFEEYFNDKQCYPFEQAIENCGSSELDPYLKRIPCDPVTKTPYLYVPGAPTLCSGYRICTKLENTSDPDIARIGCDPVSGCGWAPGYNFCLAAGYEAVSTGDNAWTAGDIGGATPTPTPLPPVGNYACQPNGGGCNNYANPSCIGWGAGCCPVTYADSNCMYNGVDQCASSANWCQN